jgi:hypothetical protein
MPSSPSGEGIVVFNGPGDEMGNHFIGAGTPSGSDPITGRWPSAAGAGSPEDPAPEAGSDF